MTDSRKDPEEVVAAIGALLKLAANNNLAEEIGERALDVRARATLALALFLPHEEARKSLLALMVSSKIPERIRSVAADAINDQ